MNPELEELREMLIEAARDGQVCNYQPIGELFDLDMENPRHRRRIGEMLGDVSRYEVGQGRPMLSCLVVLAGGDLPGSGFYKLGRELGLVESGEDDMAFAARQMKATFAYWRNAAAETNR
jgi:hypothetical protein